MFKNVLQAEKEIALKSKDTILNNETCVIAKGTRIEGIFRATEDVRLDGEIVGEVNCERKLYIGELGRIKGDLKSNSSIIAGVVDGDLRVIDSIHLLESAQINGNISANSIIVEPGAVCNGNCSIGEQE